jgi:hypothetical protein
VDGPPGQHKDDPGDKPCGKGPKEGHDSGSNGMVVILPLALGGVAAAIRTRLVFGSRRLVRTGRSKARRRGRGSSIERRPGTGDWDP